MKTGSMRTTAIIAAALLAGCAKITAPSIDFAGPTPSFDARATAVNTLFSHFTGDLTVSAVSVQHLGPTPPVTAAAAAGSSAGVTTVRLSATPTFSVGDLVSVTWSGNASTPVGTAYVVTRSAQYKILAASLVVQTPWGGMGPGESGTVCVALLPNAPGAVTVTLASSAVALAPGSLTIAAGQPRAAAAATATMGGFTCPLPAAGAASAIPQPPRCDGTNGVTASATLGGLSIHGCGNTTRSCCGVSDHSCGSAVAPPASVCP